MKEKKYERLIYALKICLRKNIEKEMLRKKIEKKISNSLLKNLRKKYFFVELKKISLKL
jgi:hypothetical protein